MDVRNVIMMWVILVCLINWFSSMNSGMVSRINEFMFLLICLIMIRSGVCVVVSRKVMVVR